MLATVHSARPYSFITEYTPATGLAQLRFTISHTAKVVRHQGIMWVAESTTMNEWCGKSGYQINPYDEWLKNYDGKVYYQHLTFQNRPGWTAETRRRAFEICRMGLYGRSYESGVGWVGGTSKSSF